MDLATFLTDYTYKFLLIFIRYAGIFLITPIFSSRIIPMRIKVGISFMLALVSFPAVSELVQIALPLSTAGLVMIILKELLFGLILGFIILLVFSALQLAGQFIDMRMAFAMANVFDPISNLTVPLIGQFNNILGTIIFFAINGHHFLLRGLYRSFTMVPPGEIIFSNQLWQFVFRKAGDLFIIAFQISLPVVAAIFIADIIFGFLARTIPQMNIFIVGLPVKILVGFVTLVMGMAVFVNLYIDLFDEYIKNFMQLIKLMAP